MIFPVPVSYTEADDRYISQNVNSWNKLAVMCFMLTWRLFRDQKSLSEIAASRKPFS